MPYGHHVHRHDTITSTTLSLEWMMDWFRRAPPTSPTDTQSDKRFHLPRVSADIQRCVGHAPLSSPSTQRQITAVMDRLRHHIHPISAVTSLRHSGEEKRLHNPRITCAIEVLIEESATDPECLKEQRIRFSGLHSDPWPRVEWRTALQPDRHQK